MRVFSAFVIFVILACIALSDQSKPTTPVCSTVTGGMSSTMTGVNWAESAGTALRSVASVGDDEVNYETYAKYREQLWDKVMKLWLRSFFDAGHGRKVDPQIIKLRERQAEAEAEASLKCAAEVQAYLDCLDGGGVTAPEPERPEEEPFDPKSASLATPDAASPWSPHQRSNAATIASVAEARGLGARGAVVGLATAMQESTLNNLDHGDRDSVGLFQQRAGWGSTAVRMNPAKSAGLFYDRLVEIPNWEQMPLTRAAQAVQISAYPNAYAQWEDDAEALLAALGGVKGAAVLPEAPVCEEPGTETKPGAPVGPPPQIIDNPSGRDEMDGKVVSRVVAAQIRLAERESGIDFVVMQGGFGGSNYAASGTSHDYSGVVDISPGSVAAEKALRQAGFAAWARNIPGRSYVGSGEHIHAVSLLDPGNSAHPQITGSWARGENGLDGGKDPAPHYPWYTSLKVAKA